MWNTETKRAVITRLVDWLDESYESIKRLRNDEICRLPFPEINEEDDKDYMLLDIGGIDYELNQNNKTPESYEEK